MELISRIEICRTISNIPLLFIKFFSVFSQKCNRKYTIYYMILCENLSIYNNIKNNQSTFHVTDSILFSVATELQRWVGRILILLLLCKSFIFVCKIDDTTKSSINSIDLYIYLVDNCRWGCRLVIIHLFTENNLVGTAARCCNITLFWMISLYQNRC